jgi:ribosome-associated protein
MADYEPQEISRTAAKKEALELQELGAGLLLHSTRALKKLDLPLELLDALDQARRIKSREGLRRQMQFIGTLMRTLDEESLAAVRYLLQTREADRRATAKGFQMTETLRDRLIEGAPGILEEAAALCPKADPETLRSLANEARRERGNGKPPRASRQLFRYLRSCLTTEQMKGDSSDHG